MVEPSETEQEKEKEFKDKERLIDVAADSVFLSDIKGKLIYINDAAYRTRGYSKDKMMSMSLFDLDDPKFSETIQEKVLELVNKGWAVFESAHVCFDKSIIPVEISARIVNLDGKDRILSVVRDITVRKQAEKKMREERDRVQNYLDLAEVMMVALDLNGIVVLVNRKACDVLGYTEKDVIGNSWFEKFIPKENQGLIKGAHERNITEGIESIEYIENPIVTSDGKQKLIAWHTSVLKDEDGNIIGVLNSGDDITKRKRQEDEVRTNLKKLEETVEGTVNAMSLTVESRDPFTAGHQRRVAKLASAIASDMNMPAEEIKTVTLAATIHDIGKVQVPVELLSKPTPLSETEFSLVKAHPQIGYDIIKRTALPYPAADMVLQHHERLNGSGYPMGLSGNDIIQAARILGVADVIEAMVSTRSYRQAFAVEMALDEISDNKNTLYDAEVVDTCINLFRKKRFSFED